MGLRSDHTVLVVAALVSLCAATVERHQHQVVELDGHQEVPRVKLGEANRARTRMKEDPNHSNVIRPSGEETMTAEDAMQPNPGTGHDGGRNWPRAHGNLEALMLKREALVSKMKAIKRAPYEDQVPKMQEYRATQAELHHVETQMGMPQQTIKMAKQGVRDSMAASNYVDPSYQPEYFKNKQAYEDAVKAGKTVPTGLYKQYVMGGGHSSEQTTDWADVNTRLRGQEKANAQREAIKQHGPMAR